jgi:hypothetical protein
MEIVMPPSKKLIPWQDRERLNDFQAFFMTLTEALISPADYFEKLEIRDFYPEPGALCFFNSLFLTIPIILNIYSPLNFFAVIFVLLFVSTTILVLALALKYILRLLGLETDYWKNFHVLAYSSPAFILAVIPMVGYGLAALAFLVLVSVGLMQVYKTMFVKILPAVLLVPVLILGPYYTLRLANHWQTLHPQINSEVEAQKVLAVISIGAENFAIRNKGQYPIDSGQLVKDGYLKIDYCGQTIRGYNFSCELRSYGYFLLGKPSGQINWNQKTFTVTTGGKLWEE